MPAVGNYLHQRREFELVIVGTGLDWIGLVCASAGICGVLFPFSPLTYTYKPHFGVFPIANPARYG